MVSGLAWLRDYDGEPLPRENDRAALGTPLQRWEEKAWDLRKRCQQRPSYNSQNRRAGAS